RSVSALCASAIAADHFVDILNNDGSKYYRFKTYGEERGCFCIKNTQTGSITGVNGGVIRLFPTSDCTGNHQVLGTNSKAYNAQWVNSFSFGPWGYYIPGSSGLLPQLVAAYRFHASLHNTFYLLPRSWIGPLLYAAKPYHNPGIPWVLAAGVS
ncbi:hypothetical protein BGZ82_011138, partial [Podila clonocystis]